ncbi:hypothetical protein WJX75_005192 [Coccomyxa subellipsoidea]|uniref:J domain-containing protein n=1 Tax=Coccomyxa subellipsoidea TaxID=248742 RepID=A0ABR2YYC0_9CHLO
MGATVWQRDGQGGKTFKTGIQQNPQRPGKRKLVWKRDDQQAHNPPEATTREQLERAEAERKVRAAQEELEALRRGIAEREQRLAREQREAAAWEAGQRWQRDDMARRKSRLEAGFAEAFKQAKQTAAADMAKPGRAPVSAADTAEVARVLAARDDYEVLGVQPGASSAAARRRYREMAVALHPDKCRVPKAKDAFQRLVRAYQEVTKSVA